MNNMDDQHKDSLKIVTKIEDVISRIEILIRGPEIRLMTTLEAKSIKLIFVGFSILTGVLGGLITIIWLFFFG